MGRGTWVSVSFTLLCSWSPVGAHFSVACVLPDFLPWVVWGFVSCSQDPGGHENKGSSSPGRQQRPSGNGLLFNFSLGVPLFTQFVGLVCFLLYASSSIHLKDFITKILYLILLNGFSGGVSQDTGLPRCRKWKSPFNGKCDSCREGHNLQHFPKPFDHRTFLLRKVIEDGIPELLWGNSKLEKQFEFQSLYSKSSETHHG